MSTIESGTIALIDGAVEIFKRDEYRNPTGLSADVPQIGYSIVQHFPGRVFRTTPFGDVWDHYRYTFVYRLGGRRIQITWMSGTGRGEPTPTEGLASAFFDAHTVEDIGFQEFADDFGYDISEPEEYRRAQRIYDACEKMDARLNAFFGDDAEVRTSWDEATHED